MPGGDTSNGQSGAVAPPSSTFHQITPPKYLDLKHSGEIAENWKLWKEKYNNYFVISRLDREIKITADIVFGRDPVHNNAFSFVKVYIFTRFGLAFTLKRSNGGLGSKKKKKVFRKQRFIVLMRSDKKEDSQKR